VLRNLQKTEVIAVLSLAVILDAKKLEKVNIDDVQDHCSFLLKSVLKWQANIQTHIFREIIKRLQAFGLITMTIEHSKITENVFLQLSLYKDDMVNGFKEKDFAMECAKSSVYLQGLF
jgi:ribosomal protein S25